MSDQQTYREPRYRINASQSAKGYWQLDATIEDSKDRLVISDSKDIADIETISLGEKLLQIIKETEEAFRKDGRKLAGDAKE